MNPRREERNGEAIQEPPTAPGSADDDGPLARINQEIRRVGLVPRGALRLDEAERRGATAAFATIVLIGMAGREGWRAFADAPERRDSAPHPLDRWSRRLISGLACACGGQALYPFDGPPYLPFQQWALRADPVHISPLGMLVHREYGLWHSYRGALAFQEEFRIPQIVAEESPCEACVSRPCLSVCPVNAFSSLGYDAPRCAAHLKSDDGADCVTSGCLARRACPVGADLRQDDDQATFHMRAFIAARNETHRT